MTSYPTTPSQPSRLPGRSSEPGPGPFWMVATMLLGFAVAVVCLFALLMWSDARRAHDDTAAAVPSVAVVDTADHAHAAIGSLESFAGDAPANAADLAAAHEPFPAALPAAPPGPVADVSLRSPTERSRSRLASSTPRGRGPVARPGP